MREVGKEGATNQCTHGGHHVGLAALAPNPTRKPIGTIHHAKEQEEKTHFFEVEPRVEGEYFARTRPENHVQHKAVDVETIDGIHLRIEKNEQNQQGH